MGLKNISAAYALYPGLAPLPKVLLVWMALRSLDPPGGRDGRPAGVYFDGEESLIAAGGMSRRHTYRALGTLRDAGAIEVVESGRLRHRAVYKLRLDPLESASLGAARGTQEGAARGTQEGAADVTQLGAARGTPRSTGGGTEETRTGRTSPQATTSPAPVDEPGEGGIDLDTARQIVGQALSIETAATRIRELAADGADYTAAYIALAHQLQEGAA